MKTLIATLIMVGLSTAGMAQKKQNYKEIKFGLTSEVIEVSAHDLWQIVGPGFEIAGNWATAVDHSEGAGTPIHEGATCSERTCKLNAKGFSNIKEIITIYDEQKKILAFDVTEGLPGFVQVSNSHWQIIDLGNNQCKIEITITAKADKFMGTIMGGMLKSNFKKTIPTIFRDLKIYAETGSISKEKKERLNKINDKRLASN